LRAGAFFGLAAFEADVARRAELIRAAAARPCSDRPRPAATLRVPRFGASAVANMPRAADIIGSSSRCIEDPIVRV
jgi:hypothetical protein